MDKSIMNDDILFSPFKLNNFLSSYSNRRTDEYGGSVENRYRFAHKIIQAVRQVVPTDRLLTFRVSNWGVADMDVSLCADKMEWQQIIKMLSNALYGVEIGPIRRQIHRLPAVPIGGFALVP